MHSIREELESSVTPLLREILDDARKLMRQEAQLIRVEVREESVKTRRALSYLISGSCGLFIAMLLLAFMLVQLVATEWLKAPLWVAFGVVGVVSGLLGVAFVLLGARELRHVRDSSERAMKTLREGLGWMPHIT